MYTFTAIDFETANPEPNSICQIGLIRIKDGRVEQEINLLVRPPKNYYWQKFVAIHGIRPEQTAFSPNFAEIWKLISPYIQGQHVVAHNAAFDMSCLRKTLMYYGIEPAHFTTHCTYKIYKKGLAKLCQEWGIQLQHHDALSDARACAALFIKHLSNAPETLI